MFEGYLRGGGDNIKSEKMLIWAFFKFGTKENILQLLNNGEIFFNIISTFTEMKDDFRGDIYEGASEIISGKSISRLYYTNSSGQSIDFKQNGLDVTYLINRPNWTGKPTHMYCLYMFQDKKYKSNEQVIDPRNLQFGDYCLSINNPEEFIKRIRNELANRQYPYIGNRVEYVDIDLSGRNYGLFKKPNTYGYQNEYRFLIKLTDNNPIKIYLGSLKDIATVLRTEDIHSFKWINDD